MKEGSESKYKQIILLLFSLACNRSFLSTRYTMRKEIVLSRIEEQKGYKLLNTLESCRLYNSVAGTISVPFTFRRRAACSRLTGM